MGILDRMRVATKAARLAFINWGGQSPYATNPLTFVFPGSRLDDASLNEPIWSNSAVMACTAWMQRTLPEAKLTVVRRNEVGVLVPDWGHGLNSLFSNPNPYYSMTTLLQAVVFSGVECGNAYLWKARDGLQRTRELWYIPHKMIKAQWPESGTPFISHYAYNTGHGIINLPVKDVIHIRWGMNPYNTREGITPLYAAGREISTDNEASTYTRSIMRNFGTPGALLNPKDPTTVVNDETRAALDAWWTASFTGDNRGKPLIPSVAVDLEKLGLTPEELALDKIREVPEDRICSVLGIPTMVVGLTAGRNSKSYANYREARDAALENNIIPTHGMIAEVLTQSLLREITQDPELGVGWDYNNVLSLQSVLDKKWARVINAMDRGGITPNEARSFLGLKPSEDPEANKLRAAQKPSSLGTANFREEGEGNLGRPSSE